MGADRTSDQERAAGQEESSGSETADRDPERRRNAPAKRGASLAPGTAPGMKHGCRSPIPDRLRGLDSVPMRALTYAGTS
jgi:hypothetical protein